MMNKRTWTMALALVVAGLAGAPANPAGRDEHRVVIEETLSIGTLDDDLLYQLTGVAVDSEGFIYVLDAMDYSLKKFDAGGRLVGKTGRKGQGPGEFLAPRMLECSGNRLFATDQYRTGIQVFDLELAFQATIPCRAPIQALRALGPNRVAGLTMGAIEPAGLLVLDTAGTVLTNWPFADTKEGMLMNSAGLAVLPDGSYVIAYVFRDRVERWTADGRRLWSRSFLGPKKVPVKKVDSPVGALMLPTETCYHDLAVDSGGRLYILGGRLAANPARDVLVLDAGGRHLTTFTLPQSSHCLVIDGKDHLYVRANDGVTLKKYRIRYE
jgi:hypothetical protein